MLNAVKPFIVPGVYLIAGLLIGANNSKMITGIRKTVQGFVMSFKVVVKLCSYLKETVNKAIDDIKNPSGK